MGVTKHGKKRLKQRCHVKKKAAKKTAKKAFNDGLKHCETKGDLNRWLTKIYFKNPRANNLRVYHDNVYIFSNKTLITVFPIPLDIKEHLEEMIVKPSREVC